MIKSMTGFGRGETVSEECKLTVEMKAVNHRYCDLGIKIPKKLNYLETPVRQFLKKNINRGKIDVFVTYEKLSEQESGVRLNEALGRDYFNAFAKLSEVLAIPNDATVSKIARFPEVLVLDEQELDLEKIEDQLIETVKIALEQFSLSRAKEGEHLKNDILEKLAGMEEHIDFVETRYPELVAEYRNKLLNKVHEILEDTSIDEARLATEVVLYADKICVDEETVRLRSHIKNMADELKKGGNVGRKLDFIAQEMNREANTILSKANDLSISNHAIELKTDIEKVREQIQNIE